MFLFLSGPVLQERATQFAQLSTSRQEVNDVEGFTCTRAWIDRFKKRHNIRTGKIHGEADVVSPEITEEWLTTIWSSAYTTIFLVFLVDLSFFF